MSEVQLRPDGEPCGGPVVTHYLRTADAVPVLPSDSSLTNFKSEYQEKQMVKGAGYLGLWSLIAFHCIPGI